MPDKQHFGLSLIIEWEPIPFINLGKQQVGISSIIQGQRVDKDKLREQGFFSDDTGRWRAGTLLRDKNGDHILVGDVSVTGGYSDALYYSLGQFTHYSTSLIDSFRALKTGQFY